MDGHWSGNMGTIAAADRQQSGRSRARPWWVRAGRGIADAWFTRIHTATAQTDGMRMLSHITFCSCVLPPRLLQPLEPQPPDRVALPAHPRLSVTTRSAHCALAVASTSTHE